MQVPEKKSIEGLTPEAQLVVIGWNECIAEMIRLNPQKKKEDQ